MRLDVVTLCLVLCAQGCTLFLTPLRGDDAGESPDSTVDADVGDDADAPDTRDSDTFDVDIDRFDADDANDADDDAGDADEDIEPPPAVSCAELFDRDPDLPDGNYNIFVGGSYVEVYCDMSNGGWTRVVHFDSIVDECPGDQFSNDDPEVCRLDIDGCSGTMASAYFAPDLEAYREVRGYARAYQYYSMDAFRTVGTDIDGYYVDGLSITYGSSPRQHIWTLASGLMMTDSVNSCPCDNGAEPPDFVGSHYYCDSGNFGPGYESVWYTGEPLWGGGEDAECGAVEEPGWFETDLGTTVSDSIEVRILQGGCDENTSVYELVLFVR